MAEKFHSHLYPYRLMLPAVAIFTVFFIGPALFGLGLSLTDARITDSDFTFVGLDNYRTLFGDSAGFIGAVTNQFLFAIATTLGKTVIGVALALLLDRAFVGRNFVRALVYLPIMFSTIVIGIVFTFLLDQEGMVNSFLDGIGLSALAFDWFGDFDIALYAVAGVDVWIGVGWTVVIVLAALQAVPGDVIEAASLDGAGPVRMLTRIKLPLILHAVNLAMVLTLISGMKAFDIIYATTKGGPGKATEVISTYIASKISTGSIVLPAAASFAQLVLICAVALTVNAFVRRMEAKESA